MGQVKGNPTPTAEHAAFEAKYPNTGRANRDLGQIITPAVEEVVVEVVEEVAPAVETKSTKKASAKAASTAAADETPSV